MLVESLGGVIVSEQQQRWKLRDLVMLNDGLGEVFNEGELHNTSGTSMRKLKYTLSLAMFFGAHSSLLK